MSEENTKKFRSIYVVEPVHDLSILKEYTDSVRFITTGGERVEELKNRIEEALKDFDGSKDAIIPMGRSSACIIAGFVLHNLSSRATFGIYRLGGYEFIEVKI